MRAHAVFLWVRSGVAYLADADDGAVSVTNDAEAVVAFFINMLPPDTRLVYQDTMGRWDELKHSGGKFTGFAPWLGWTPDGRSA
jgi:hypothetical protein